MSNMNNTSVCKIISVETANGTCTVDPGDGSGNVSEVHYYGGEPTAGDITLLFHFGTSLAVLGTGGGGSVPVDDPLIMATGKKTSNYTPAANADIPVGWESRVDHPDLPYTGGTGRCDFTIKVSGTYLFEGQLKLERNTTNPTARQQIMIWKNGAAFFVAYKLSNSTTYETLNIVRSMRLAVDDTVGLYYRTGATGNVILGDGNASGMTLTRLGS